MKITGGLGLGVQSQALVVCPRRQHRPNDEGRANQDGRGTRSRRALRQFGVIFCVGDPADRRKNACEGWRQCDRLNVAAPQ